MVDCMGIAKDLLCDFSLLGLRLDFLVFDL